MLIRAVGLAVVGGLAHAALEAARLLYRHAQGWDLAELSPGLALEALLAALALLPLALLVRRPARGLAVLAVALLGGQLAARALVPAEPAAPVSPPGATDARTVVLVTADTLRRDHVSAYPDAVHPGLTPRVDGLAREGWLFLDAVTPAPLTLPAHAALLGGRHPVDVGVIRNGRALPPDWRGVASDLADAGFRTGAFVSSPVLHGDHGVRRGFHAYRDALGLAGARHLLLVRLAGDLRAAVTGDDPAPTKEPGDRTVDRALDWLGRQPDDAPVFLWVHLYDAHTPHAERPGLEPRARPALGHPCDWSAHPSAVRRAPPHPYLPARAPLPPEGDCRARNWAPLDAQLVSYAAEVRFLDAQVGRLLDGLEARGRGDAAVIFVADHGESLVEHQQHVRHQYALRAPVVRVPLVVRAPGLAPATVEGTVGTIRVAATLRRLAGLPPDPSLGPDLLAGGADRVLAVGPAPVEGRGDRTPAQVLAVEGPLEVLRDATGHVERYDRATDPRERWPLLTAEEQARLAAAVEAFGRPADRPVSPLLARPLDEASRAALAQPGVLGRAVAPEALERFAPLDAAARGAIDAWREAPEAEVGGLPDGLREALEALGYL